MSYLNYEPSTGSVKMRPMKNKISKTLIPLVIIVATRNVELHKAALQLLISTTKLVWATVIFIVEDPIPKEVVLQIKHVTSCLKVFVLTF